MNKFCTIWNFVKPSEYYYRGKMDKIKVGIIGTGNIGTDILIKSQRSEALDLITS